jgi:hypothetical protein
MLFIYFFLVTFRSAAAGAAKKETSIKTEKTGPGEKWTATDIENLKKDLQEINKQIEDAKKDNDGLLKEYEEAYSKVSEEKGFFEWKKDAIKAYQLEFVNQTDQVKKEIDDLMKKSSDSEITKKIEEIFGDETELVNLFWLNINSEATKQLIIEVKNARKHFYGKPSFYVFLSGSIGLAVGIVLMIMQSTGDRLVVYLVLVISGLVAIGGAVWIYLQRANKMFLYKSDALASGSTTAAGASAESKQL